MDYEDILLDFDYDTGVALLTLNRSHRLNALNGNIRVEMTDAVQRVLDDDDIGALILTGAGDRSFSVGADIKDPSSNHSVEDFNVYMDGQRQKGGWYRLLHNCRKGVVAAVNGYCAGSGVQLALTADVLVGTPSTQFWIPQVGLGLAPHVGSLVKLARILGQQRMLALVLTGERLSAEEAHRVGLLWDVVESDSLVDRAKEIAAKIAGQPRLAVELAKTSYYEAIDMTWDQAMLLDKFKQFGMWQTEERRQRHAAFVEKSG